MAELARRIGLSGPAVADRLRRLEDTGTLSYRADVDPRALGYTLFAIVRISPSGGGLRLIPGIAREVPAITECYRITGEDCYFSQALPALHRRAGTDPRPVHPARPHDHLDRALGPGPAAPAAYPRALISARTCPAVRRPSAAMPGLVTR